MDPTDIGRYGTLSLLRRLPVESVVTSYPIDDEELTIGRDQSCSLRLYYPAVSALHAKIPSCRAELLLCSVYFSEDASMLFRSRC